MVSKPPLDPRNDGSEDGMTSEPISKAISDVVIRAIAEKKGCEPANLTPPLYDVLDPDALDAMYGRSSPRTVFEYAGYQVTIHPNESITVIDTSR
ncbi:HalOD1 output domain-containing protein [Haladaptatus caseinilyticus]|uniref:HalOD1 output domain-containing protein n=1 Tax=Haladaptatus caseinilyticus TaxID=2993314 RepID=UPI00224A4B31|nr:HalOD1 output domain-containing protein [Haladaptatus caseinilyticus]